MKARSTSAVLVCSLAALDLSSSACRATGPRPDEREGGRPNILVYMIDTLRAREIGVYGSEVTRTPAMDRFAAESVVFENARTPSSWTRPAVASLLTGVAPDKHGIRTFSDVLGHCVPSLVRLPELLQRQGYFTGAVIANPQVDPIFGFEPGFDVFTGLYEERTDRHRPRVEEMVSTAPVVVDEVKRVIASVPGERPFFLFALSIDPHGPYTPPSPYDTRYDPRDLGPGLEDGDFAETRRRMNSGGSSPEKLASYRGEVSFADAAFGDLVAWLRERKLLDDTLVVLTADHGEEFAEHGLKGHGKTLYEEVIHIPLIVRHPTSFEAGSRRSEDVDLMDLGATLAAAGGATLPVSWSGWDLRRAVAPGLVVATSGLRHPHYYTAVTGDGFKLIGNEITGATELYALEEDPREHRPLDPGRAPTGARGHARALEDRRTRAEALEERLEECPPLPDEPLPEDVRRQLETLGYVEGSEPVE